MTDTIDLNADLGESYGSWKMGSDADMLAIVSSANIACGFHAGDPLVMAETVRLASEHKVGIGAHPGYHDLRGFGRFPINNLPLPVAYNDIVYQIGALQAIAASQQLKLRHVKLHGAMNNVACADRPLADTFVDAVLGVDPSLIIVAVANTELEHAATAREARVVREVFADRAYQDNGLLVPRNQRGAVIHDPALASERVLRMVCDRQIISANGRVIPVEPDTVCVHGDNPAAVAMAEAVRASLEKSGIAVRVFESDG